MSKGKAGQKKRKEQKSLRKAKRKPVIIICSLLMLTLAIGVMAQWRILPGTSKPLALSPNPTGSFNANSPSKEYIYAGGRLVATEEPPADLAPTPTPTPTPTPSQTLVQQSAPGPNHSLDPNGTWVEIPNSSSLNITGAITVEAWIKTSGTSAVRGIVERFGANSGQGGYALRLSDGKLRFYTLTDGYNHDHIDSTSNISINTWHHVAAVFDGSQLRLYIDGVLDASKASTFAPGTGNTNLIIGNTGFSVNTYAGLIDEVRVTAGAVYTSNFIPQSHLTALSNTRGMWKFDGENAQDSSGQGNHGMLGAGGQYSTEVPLGAMETIWFDDELPAGASETVYPGGGAWNWITANPPPRSGAKAHQSVSALGFHNHYFTGATTTLPIGTGDKLFTYIYLDPANMPLEVMLQWHDGTTWYNAYWGEDQITTVSRQYVGPLPGAGGWVRLEVPASLLGLEGKTISGMAFNLYDGKATWDRAGKLPQGQ